MVTGIIKGFKYEKSEYNLTQGHGAYERSGYRGGRYINQRGFGWASESKPSRITLKIDVDGIIYDVWVDRYFKDNWGRLTAGRVAAIQKTTPKSVELHENFSNYGTCYYTVSDRSMALWLENALAVR